MVVVTAIIGCLVLLGIHFVVQAREAGRRASCANNLKQLVLAVQNYSSTWEVLPPTSGKLAGGNDFSMKARLLPFMDSSHLYSDLNHAKLSTDPANWTSQCFLVYWFLCPSDANVPCGVEPSPAGVGSPRQIGYSSYPNNIGTLFRKNDGKFDGPAYVLGKASLGPPVTLGMIVDGTANTVMFSEWIRGRNGSTEHGLFQVYSAAATLPTRDSYYDGEYALDTQFAAPCLASNVLDSTLGDHKGRLWMRGNCGEGGGYSHIMPPNQKACLFQRDALDPFHTMIGVSSNHPGGVNVGMVDGSVKFISDHVNPATWRSLATYELGSRPVGPSIY
jgi:prepilin-type processing-associated H-X9-DG protein